MKNTNRRYFMLAVMTPLIADFIVTSIGQPSAYWQGLGVTNEGNPLIEPILRFHYAAFAAGFLFYAAFVFFLLRKLPWKGALWLGLFLFISHAWGSSTWIPEMLFRANIQVNDWYITILYHAALAILMGKGIFSYCKERPETGV